MVSALIDVHDPIETEIEIGLIEQTALSGGTCLVSGSRCIRCGSNDPPTDGEDGLSLPSQPLHALFHLHHAALTPAPIHSGFERVVFAYGVGVKTSDFSTIFITSFECHYGGDGMLPLDRWFGTFHDGNDVAQKRTDDRFLTRSAQIAAGVVDVL